MNKIVVGGMATYRVHPNIQYIKAIPPIPNGVIVNILAKDDNNRDCLIQYGNHTYIVDQKMLLEYYIPNRPLKVGDFVYHVHNPFVAIYQVLEPGAGAGTTKLKTYAIFNGEVFDNNEFTTNTSLLLLPDNNDLLNMYGVVNKEDDSTKKVINNRLDNIFTDSSLILRHLAFTYDPDKKKQQFRKSDKKVNKVEKKSSFAFVTETLYGNKATTEKPKDKTKFSQYCLVIRDTEPDFNSGSRNFFTRINGKTVYIKDNWSTKTTSFVNYEDAIKQLCTVKIKLPEESIKLFGNKSKKMKMYEESKESKKTFEITKFIWGYKCKDGKEDENGKYTPCTICDVIEVFNGEISLKFRFDEVEIIPLYTKGITKPKDRSIKKDSICIIKNNKYLNVPKFTRIRVQEIVNNRPSNRPLDPYDKRKPSKKDYIVKGQTEDGKQISCRIKHLKTI